MALIAKVIEIRVGKPVVSTLITDFKDGNDPVWIGIGQGPQQNAINDGEDRRARANSQSKGADGNRRESRALAQLAQCVTEILK